MAGSHATSDSDRTNLRAIVALCSGLGLSAVAEGIETPEQRRFLLEIGWEQGQGFMFSYGLKEVSADALARWQQLRDGAEAR